MTFLIFADGGPGYLKAASRLSGQIKRLNPEYSIEIYNRERIAIEDPVGYQLHADFINGNERGLGFWLWKPWIHYLAMNKLPDSTLIYLDVGCDLLINRRSRKRFNAYIAGALKGGVLIFQMPTIQEKHYTHCKTIEYLVEDYPHSQIGPIVTGSELESQLSASFIVWSPGSKQREIISSWFEIAQMQTYKHLTGRHPEGDKCCADLIEHRHDQSILSLLIKMNYSERFVDESHSSTVIPSTELPVWGIKNFTEETQLLVRRGRINKLSKHIIVVK